MDGSTAGSEHAGRCEVAATSECHPFVFVGGGASCLLVFFPSLKFHLSFRSRSMLCFACFVSLLYARVV